MFPALAAILVLCFVGVTAQTTATGSPATIGDDSEHISIPTEDRGIIYADLYGNGDRGVVLAHGGRFNKESWQPQAQSLARAGFRCSGI